MPIYEYQCQQCGLRVEKRQKVSDEPLTTCEKCHGRLEKQWSLSGFQFKGAGWYVTDYSGKSGEQASKTDKAEKTSTTESTAKPETASNSDSKSAKSDKSDAGSKKDQS